MKITDRNTWKRVLGILYGLFFFGVLDGAIVARNQGQYLQCIFASILAVSLLIAVVLAYSPSLQTKLKKVTGFFLLLPIILLFLVMAVLYTPPTPH